MRFPTPNEFEAMWAAQQAEEAARRLQGRTEPDMRECAVELRAREEAANPPKPILLCPACGLNFRYERAGMAQMQLNRHLRKIHPEYEG